VFLAVEADKQFKREGIDLFTDLDVDYLGGSLGGFGCCVLSLTLSVCVCAWLSGWIVTLCLILSLCLHSVHASVSRGWAQSAGGTPIPSSFLPSSPTHLFFRLS